MTIYRDTGFTKVYTFETRSDGQPVDISLWEFEANLKDASGATVLAMSIGGGQFTISDGPAGQLTLSLTDAETEALVAGPVSFVLMRTDPASPIRMALVTDQVRDNE